MIELPGVIEDGMSGRNGERKPGTTRGSPRRSRTAKASRISRHAVKSRCACGGRAMKRASLPLRRREFIALLGGGAAGWPLLGLAQQPSMRVIGFLYTSRPYPLVLNEFHSGLAEIGY